MPHRQIDLGVSVSHIFLLDGMLGSLARWLRILGYDTLYYPDMDDDEFHRKAKETDRILVTRDRELSIRAKNDVQALLIESDETISQLREMVAAYELDTLPKNTRCPRCNGVLEEKEKQLLRDLVPAESYEVFDRFWQCSSCCAVYWRGSHWTKITETLLGLMDKSI